MNIKIRKTIVKKLNGKWQWGMTVFKGDRVMATCKVASVFDLDSEEIAQNDMNEMCSILNLSDAEVV